MLDLVKNDFEKMLLENARLSLENVYSPRIFNDEIDKNLNLCIGDINNIEGDKQLIEELKQHKNFRIWYSSINSEDLNNYYYFINRIFKNVENPTIYTINLTKINKEIISISACTDKELSKFQDYQEQLTESEIKEASSYWGALEKENADLRLIENNKLVSMPYNKLENEILNELSKHEEIPEFQLLAIVVVHNTLGIKDFDPLKITLNRLIENNQIKVLRTEKMKGVIQDEITTNILSIRK